ncbi:MAG TPA: peptidogalycan biosysnthesis protein [Gemmatimonadales bacterium]|nr:peptidogalycan biosysnthesis protein [Gemmatimonadales bacterium]
MIESALLAAESAHAPPGVSRVKLLDGASDVAAAEWNRLARRGFHQHRWFVAAELSGWRARHVTLVGAAGLAAIVPAYLVADGGDGNLHDLWLGPFAAAAARLGLRLNPALCVMAPFARASAPLGEVAALPVATIDDAFAALEERARRDGARAVVWPFVDAGDTRLIEVARRRGYAALYGGAAARLAVTWTSFDGYVASRSKAVRRTVRAEREAMATAGLRLDVVEDFRGHTGAMDALLRSAYRERNGIEPRAGRAFFDRLAADPDPGIWAQLTWRGDQLVGMSVNLAAGGVLDGTFTALLPKYRGGPAYYNDLIYEPVRIACGRGIGQIDLGPTALVPKLLRGAQLRPRVTLVRGSTATSHALLAALGRVVAARTASKERKRLAGFGRRGRGSGR